MLYSRNYRIPTGGQLSPIPADPGSQTVPGGDVFGQILTELGKAIQDGRLKPVVIGLVEIPIPGQAGPAGGGQPQQAPGGDILGQILRDILSGASGQVQVPRQAIMGGAGAAVFGDQLEVGRDVEQSQLDSLQEVFNRFAGAQGR
jgi:hypothetical protein